MLEQRVARLEDDMKEIKTVLKGIEVSLTQIAANVNHLPKAADFGSLKSDVARIEGRISQMPTFLQLVGTVITTWTAGAAIVFTLIRLAR